MKTIHTLVTVLLLIVGIILIAGCIAQTNGGNITNTTPVISPPLSVLPTPSCSQNGNSEPFIIINPISAHYVGDVFEINGTTNIDAENKIKILVDEERRAAIGPYDNPELNYTYTNSQGYVNIQGGDCGRNYWSYPLNLTGFHAPKLYFVNVILEQNHSVKNFSSLFVQRVW